MGYEHHLGPSYGIGGPDNAPQDQRTTSILNNMVNDSTRLTRVKDHRISLPFLSSLTNHGLHGMRYAPASPMPRPPRPLESEVLAMGCSTRLGPSARIAGPEGVHRITNDNSILNAIQINHRLPFPSIPFPRRALNGKPCVFPPLFHMGVHKFGLWYVNGLRLLHRERGHAR